MNLKQLKEDLLADEGFRDKPYYCTAGKLSIGIGRNLEDRGVTFEEALALLDNDVLEVYAALKTQLPWFSRLADGRQRALCNMAFQMGVSGLLGFKKMLAAMARGDYALAKREALDSAWARQTPERAQRVSSLIFHG